MRSETLRLIPRQSLEYMDVAQKISWYGTPEERIEAYNLNSFFDVEFDRKAREKTQSSRRFLLGVGCRDERHEADEVSVGSIISYFVGGEINALNHRMALVRMRAPNIILAYLAGLRRPRH